MSTSAWFPRTAALVGLVSLLGAGACVPLATEASPDAHQVSPDGDEPEGGGLIPTISARGSKTAIGVRTSSLMIQRPDDVAAGDILLAHLSKRNVPNDAAAQRADWEVIQYDRSAELLHSWLLWKVAGDDEPDIYAFEISGPPDNAVGIIVAVVGADPMDPIDAFVGQVRGNSRDNPGFAQELKTPALTATESEGLAVWFGAQVWPERSCPSDYDETNMSARYAELGRLGPSCPCAAGFLVARDPWQGCI